MAPKCAANVHPEAKAVVRDAASVASATVKAVVSAANAVVNAAQQTLRPAMPRHLRPR